MKKKRIVIVSSVLGLAALCYFLLPTYFLSTFDSVITKDAKVHDLIINVSSCEAIRVDPINARKAESVSSINSIGDSVVLSSEQQKFVTRLLTSRESYEFGYAKACIPHPGIILKFHSGESKVHILLCFECYILKVEHNGKFSPYQNFDPISVELTSLIKKLFPYDKMIQDL